MKKFFSRIAMSAAAACMVVAPIAAQANTRAGDNGTIYSGNAVSQPGLGRDVSGENLVNDGDGLAAILLAILGGAAVIVAIIIIDDEDDQSPGT
ncbi:hypothetical protein [Erythrobacter sp. THAF29]|uniref:hypothetical protein n=1 Tax=Erythrobacter sp. THAF29 TaxID=2587851 RepID=UPI001269024B|nr:hypothetical protein [Erythrobacter sp. THAF29]QFT75987.1 hypothetical protein FIU90_00390 [Erythrobacter sp. THAF29]